MTIDRYMLIGACVAVFAAVSVLAATELWRTPTVSNVIQVMADGKGGCACAWFDTNATINLAWFDAKGRVRYTSEPSDIPIPILPINACTPKQLLYTTVYGFPMMVQVDKKGRAIPVATIGGFVIGSPPMLLPRNSLTDQKGFFLINVDTNNAVECVVRYSYK